MVSVNYHYLMWLIILFTGKKDKTDLLDLLMESKAEDGSKLSDQELMDEVAFKSLLYEP